MVESRPRQCPPARIRASDALIDALVAHGSPEAIYQRLNEHLAAGANHVGIQVLNSENGASPMDAYRTLAQRRPA